MRRCSGCPSPPPTVLSSVAGRHPAPRREGPDEQLAERPQDLMIAGSNSESPSAPAPGDVGSFAQGRRPSASTTPGRSGEFRESLLLSVESPQVPDSHAHRARTAPAVRMGSLAPARSDAPDAAQGGAERGTLAQRPRLFRDQAIAVASGSRTLLVAVRKRPRAPYTPRGEPGSCSFPVTPGGLRCSKRLPHGWTPLGCPVRK